MEQRKQAIMEALNRFTRQRSGMDFRDYGDVSSYRQEQRSITRDLHHARELMRAVSWRDSITADDLIAAAKHAYSGRLTIRETDKGIAIDYCTGQYFPTEYRRAVCAVLASALWDYTRSTMPEPVKAVNGYETYDGKSGGEWLRSHFRKEFGPAIANRWFD